MTVIDCAANQDEYINILAGKFHPWFQELTEDEDRCFILQEDGALCRTDAYARWWKETHQIRYFNTGLPNPLTCTPIEHLWWALEREIRSANTPPKNISSLKAIIEEQWKKQSFVIPETKRSASSDRCQAVIDVRGGPTRYFF